MSTYQKLGRGFTDMRRDKIPTVLFTTKYEAPTMQYHCAQHRGMPHVIRENTGWHCQICGGQEIATMIKMTVEKA